MLKVCPICMLNFWFFFKDERPARFQLNATFLGPQPSTFTTSPDRPKIEETPPPPPPIDYLLCPKETEAPFQLFPTLCRSNQECKRSGENQICCKIFGSKRCIEGKVNPPKEPVHEPLLYVIPRKCPTDNLAETWWNIQICETDRDCWPRVCCPDGRFKYCRTSTPQFESAPLAAARQLASRKSSYRKKAPPPPPNSKNSICSSRVNFSVPAVHKAAATGLWCSPKTLQQHPGLFP